MVRTSGSRWGLAASELAERFRQSLFLLPALCLVLALLVSQLMLAIDDRVESEELPDALVSTVGSARAVLGAIAAGTITAAALVLSLTLVAVQLASSQFSPRTLRGFLGDRLQQWIIGLIIGTVAYALLILRAVQAPPENVGRPDVPNLSVAVAVTLAIASLLAVLASIDHTARRLRVGTVADAIVTETRGVIEITFDEVVPTAAQEAPEATPAAPKQHNPPAHENVLVVRARRSGWVQQLDDTLLAECVPEQSTVYVEVAVGTYVAEGMPLAMVDPAPPDEGDGLSRQVRSAVRLGDERSMQQDVGFGIVRLVDIALRALSPGMNDPNTADEILARLGDVFISLYERPLTAAVIEIDGRTIIRAADPDHEDYLRAAFDPIRRAAAGHPEVLATLIRTLGTIRRETARRRPDADLAPIDALAERAASTEPARGFDDDARRLILSAIEDARSG